MKKHVLLSIFFVYIFVIGSANAQEWKALTTSSSDLKSPFAAITSIASDSSGNVYASGTFMNADNHTYIAKWNGTTWSELGNLGNGFSPVKSICTDKDGNVYAAGSFINSSSYNYVAKWNGTSWSELGGLNALKANANIDIIISDDAGNIYATGFFTDEHIQHYVAKWDGTSWTEVGGLSSLNPNGEITAMAVDKDLNLYVGGGKQDDDTGIEIISKWDGSQWTEIGASSAANAFTTNTDITSIGVTPSGDVYVGNDNKNTDDKYCIAKWNGAVWSQLPVNITDANTPPLVHVDYYGNLYVSGYVDQNGPGNALEYNVYKWNGTSFVQLGHLNGSGIVIDMYSDKKGNLYAGGFFNDASTHRPFVAEYTASVTTAVIAGTYAESNIKIYPNPAQDIVAVDVPADLIGIAYYIYDSRGILHESGRLTTGSNTVSIDQLPAGLYFIQLGDLSKNAFKLVKK